MDRAEWEAAMAKGVAAVERERDRKLEDILDARCPGSRRPLTEAHPPLAAGIENRLAGSVERASVNGLKG